MEYRTQHHVFTLSYVAVVVFIIYCLLLPQRTEASFEGETTSHEFIDALTRKYATKEDVLNINGIKKLIWNIQGQNYNSNNNNNNNNNNNSNNNDDDDETTTGGDDGDGGGGGGGGRGSGQGGKGVGGGGEQGGGGGGGRGGKEEKEKEEEDQEGQGSDHKVKHTKGLSGGNKPPAVTNADPRCPSTKSKKLCAAEQCMPLDSFLGLFTTRDNQTFGKKEFETVLPALVYRLQVEKCSVKRDLKSKVRPTTFQTWLYGIGFSLLVCTVSMIGSILVPCMNTAYFSRCLQFLVGMGASCLYGTAIIILIPHAIHLDITNDYLAKVTTFSAVILLLNCGGNILKCIYNRRKEQSKEVEIQNHPMMSTGHNHHHSSGGSSGDNHELHHSNSPGTVGWVVLIGDMLHNFLDGISMGAAFTMDLATGFSISLAIICEELPHELADIAILVSSGLRIKRALLYNFLAALPCVLGLIVGILIGGQTASGAWIFAATGGLFMYISLGVIIPEMREVSEKMNEMKVHILHITGLTCGFVIVIILALYADNINI
ncbi:zinc transporter ZIP6-like [Argonauta hians]